MKHDKAREQERILKDIDDVCRSLTACIHSSARMIGNRQIENRDAAEAMSTLVVNMGSLLLELQQSRFLSGGQEERIRRIADLASSIKSLEGMVKEVRNDLRQADDGRDPASRFDT